MAKVEIKLTAGANPKKYISIETDAAKVSVFPIVGAKPGKGSELAYNASIIFLKSNVAITADVRRIIKEGDSKGQLLIGSASHRLDGHRVIVSEFLKEFDEAGGTVRDENGNVKGKVIEKTSIPTGQYNAIMEAITEGEKLLAASAAV